MSNDQDAIEILQEMVKVDVDLIENHPENPRIGNVEAIKASLLALGQFVPLVVQTSTGYILSGNHTYKGIRELGWTEAHVVYLDVEDGPARRIMLAANKIAEMGTYNTQLLAELITAAMEDDESLLESTGYSDEEIDTLLSEALDFDFGLDDESTEGVGAVAAVLDRITPVEGDDGVIDGGDEDDEPFVPQASKGGGGRAASTVGAVETEFVIFRFGELRAKIPRSGYEAYITSLLKEHSGDLQLAGVSAAVSLGLDSEGVEPAIANGAERWL